jgi:hypothetical protein
MSHPTCNQTPANITNTIDINLGLGDTPRDFQRLSFSPGTCNFERDRFDLRRDRGSNGTGMFKPCRNALFAARAFPADVFSQCSISRWNDWRGVGSGWSGWRSSAHFAGFEDWKLRVLDFINRAADGGAKSFAMLIDLAERVVATRFRTCEHAIEASRQGRIVEGSPQARESTQYILG